MGGEGIEQLFQDMSLSMNGVSSPDLSQASGISSSWNNLSETADRWLTIENLC